MSALSSPLGIASIVLVIIAFILAIIGIVLLVMHQNTSKPWYVWLLVIAGISLGIIAAIMLTVALMNETTPEEKVLLE